VSDAPLPEVLAGPFLRHTTPTEAYVWLATSVPLTILDETLTFDDLPSISSAKAFTAAQESALRAEVMSKWEEHEHWFVRTPTELVRLRPLDAELPRWTWNPNADLSQGIAWAWKNSEEP
jgi:hypothetical protein